MEWVLAHPRTSSWLKKALRAARDGDPVDVLNEVEILRFILECECAARLGNASNPAERPEHAEGEGGVDRQAP